MILLPIAQRASALVKHFENRLIFCEDRKITKCDIFWDSVLPLYEHDHCLRMRVGLSACIGLHSHVISNYIAPTFPCRSRQTPVTNVTRISA